MFQFGVPLRAISKMAVKISRFYYINPSILVETAKINNFKVLVEREKRSNFKFRIFLFLKGVKVLKNLKENKNRCPNQGLEDRAEHTDSRGCVHCCCCKFEPNLLKNG